MAVAYRVNTSLSSDDDSDDSDKESCNWKRSLRTEEEDLEKIPIAPPPTNLPAAASENQTSKRKRNNIWSEVIQDQIISETLDVCGIKNKPKGYGNRGAESYDYTLGKKLTDSDKSDDEVFHSRSRSSSANSRSRKRFKGDKYVDMDDKEDIEAARKIVRVLAEQKTYLIFRIVKYLGKNKALKLLSETETIEENGGLMVKNMQRRRTPGGVYLHLVRSDKSIDKEILDKIFEGELNSFEAKKKFQELRKKRNKKRVKSNRNKQNKMDCESIASTSGTTSLSSLPSSPEEKCKIDNIAMEAIEDSGEKDKKDIANIETYGEMSDLEEGEIM